MGALPPLWGGLNCKASKYTNIFIWLKFSYTLISNALSCVRTGTGTLGEQGQKEIDFITYYD